MKTTATTPSKPKAKAKPRVSTSTRTAGRKKANTGTTPERLRAMIAEEAYLRAERRGFQNGNPVQDWLDAEQEITHRLTLGSGTHSKS